MGAVYKATHLGTTRAVAIKIIHPQLSGNQEFVERFRREAEASGRLRHPNVVDVTDFGFARTRSGQVAYLVMGYLDGCTLAEVLDEERRLPTSWVIDILDQVCSAVDEAHRLGIIHRDLKPENIWLEPNRRGGYTVKVLDFGLAKLGDRAEPATAPATAGAIAADGATLVQSSLETIGAGLTRVGSMMGTPLYMSPEQCRGESLDARADIYSLGVIAYRMLAGETPFTGDPGEVIRLHCTGEPPPFSDKRARVPKRMAGLVMAALAKSPSARPDSAAGFGTALRASTEGSGSLLRQAVSLYSEHFPAFLKISLLAHVPLIGSIVGLVLLDRPSETVAPAVRAIVGPLVFGSSMAQSTHSAARAPPVVTQHGVPMKKLVLILAVACVSCAPQAVADKDVTGWERQAQSITIIRDDWGIAHVYGKTDADAVFGVMYAQAEDDFNRVETNYLNSMGRLAEAEGESGIYRDLRMKIFIDPDDMKAQYQKAPEWLKSLMNAYADGLNYYLYKHPQVTPRVIKHFEPWMALTFSEGSIGGDIERVNLTELENFYGNGPKKLSLVEPVEPFAEPAGSNGAAVAPANTTAHHSLLLINPHTSFYFRSEAQMVSDEGLNAYGALTWGQFFIYQGFNERAGWMHTSSGVDNIDEYLETVVKKGDGFAYKYGSEERPVTTTKISVPYKSGNT